MCGHQRSQKAANGEVMYTPLKDSARMTDCFMSSEASDYTKCWASQPEPIKDAMNKDHSLQGLLFSLGDPAQKPTNGANHPTPPPKATETRFTPGKQTESPNPYVLRHHSYSEFLKWFNGNSTLAQYWFNQQDKKE